MNLPRKTQPLHIVTDLPPDELREKLRAWEPWGALVEFSNGVTTEEFERLPWFMKDSTFGARRFERHIPFESLEMLLDVGCNVGHNSIFLARKYGLRVVGIDMNPEHVEAATFLSEASGVEGEFLLAHAESFVRPCDVVLHFGILYHLHNPFRSLKAASDSLEIGGYLALETLVHHDPENERACIFVYGLGGGRSSYFALSPFTIRTCLGHLGFDEPIEVFRHEATSPPGEHLFRIGLATRKSGETQLWPPWT